jgi:hypothetical protein
LAALIQILLFVKNVEIFKKEKIKNKKNKIYIYIYIYIVKENAEYFGIFNFST